MPTWGQVGGEGAGRNNSRHVYAFRVSGAILGFLVY